MLLSAVSVLVVAQSSWEIPEGLMNNPVLLEETYVPLFVKIETCSLAQHNLLCVVNRKISYWNFSKSYLYI